MREQSARVYDRSANVAANLTNHYMLDGGDHARERLAEITAPTLVLHGSEDPMFPLAHGQALADEIPGAELIVLEGTGHEYFPRHTWDVVVPAILRQTAGATGAA
jgi:pimeloyl-ACP methyl ester carboxylesterase